MRSGSSFMVTTTRRSGTSVSGSQCLRSHRWSLFTARSLIAAPKWRRARMSIDSC